MENKTQQCVINPIQPQRRKGERFILPKKYTARWCRDKPHTGTTMVLFLPHDTAPAPLHPLIEALVSSVSVSAGDTPRLSQAQIQNRLASKVFYCFSGLIKDASIVCVPSFACIERSPMATKSEP